MRHRLKTFVVEDNETIRHNLVAALEELAGAAVVGFSDTESGAVGWLNAHTSEWDLAIVDLFLKEGSGLGVLKATAQRAPAQKIVVLSNYATADIRRRCAELGVDAVFDKSNEIEELVTFCMRHDAALEAHAGAQC